MRRTTPLPLTIVLPLLLSLAGCDGSAPFAVGPAGPAVPIVRLRAAFPVGGVVDTIVVEAVERLPLRRAELIAPDGTTTPASSIEAATSPRFAVGQFTSGDPSRGLLGGGLAPAVTMPQAPVAAALQSQEQLLAIVSSADIPLPDPVAYRRDWARYRIRLSFGTPPGEVETRELPAPAPPPPGS